MEVSDLPSLTVYSGLSSKINFGCCLFLPFALSPWWLSPCFFCLGWVVSAYKAGDWGIWWSFGMWAWSTPPEALLILILGSGGFCAGASTLSSALGMPGTLACAYGVSANPISCWTRCPDSPAVWYLYYELLYPQYYWLLSAKPSLFNVWQTMSTQVTFLWGCVNPVQNTSVMLVTT